MTPIKAAGRGAAAGVAGAALAHALTVLLARRGAGEWLHGPFGPPFFAAALYTGVFYAAIGAGTGRRAAAAAGFFGGFLGLSVPLYVLTRYGGWTPQQWPRVMIGVYILAIWGTIAWIGAAAARGRPWRAAVAAMLGSLAGYAVLSGGLALFTGLARTASASGRLRPPLVDMLDGALSGAGLCLALSLDDRLSKRRTS